MSDSEAPLYDHARDLELELGRPLPDWGGDEVFATVPRRRFSAPVAAPPRTPRVHGGAAPSRGAHESRGAVAPRQPRRFSGPNAAPRGGELRPAAPPERREPEIAANGRRTVVITGRPHDHARRRPSRTVDERIGHRPDRVAAWAVGLGFGLVVAAIATAPL